MNYRCFRNCSHSILAAIHNQNFLIISLVTLKPINQNVHMLIHTTNSLPWSSFTEVNFLTHCLLNKGIPWLSKVQLGTRKNGKKRDFQPVSLSDKYGDTEVFFLRPTESVRPISLINPLLIKLSKINLQSQLQTCLFSKCPKCLLSLALHQGKTAI